MAWTAPRTWVATNVLTAAQLNTDIRDNMLFLGTRKNFRIRKVASQTITTGVTTAISFDTEDVDTDGYGAVPATTYSIPAAVAGYYSITAVATFATASAGTQPFVRMIAGGLTYDAPVALATGIGTITVSMPLVTSDTVGVSVFQNSGGNLGCTCTLYAAFVGR